MDIKFLGFLDLLSVFAFVLGAFGVFKVFVVVMAIYLLFKGIVFFSDISSWIDSICGLYLVSILFGFSAQLSILCIVWLLQKSIISFFS